MCSLCSSHDQRSGRSYCKSLLLFYWRERVKERKEVCVREKEQPFLRPSKNQIGMLARFYISLLIPGLYPVPIHVLND